MKKSSVLLVMLVSFQAIAVERTVQLSVPGMNCPVCPITVRKSLLNVAGVKAVKVNYDAKTAVVRYEDEKARVDQLIQATTNAGYPAQVIQGK